MPNRLASETSPYLLQHAGNPVEWYPWGEEALRTAREQDKPIFLSIGYSACHWCHVMAHESFEDERVAQIMNEHFVNIKVDREERPDLDQIYMAAVQALTGSGGWPMSVFLTPEGEPFYGGTYFPPQPRYGMPSFPQVLTAIAQAWDTRREELVRGGRQLAQALQEQTSAASATRDAALEPETLHAAYQVLTRQFDAQNGGWGGAPKFPQPMVLEFLLRYHAITGNEQALEMVTKTLDKMARGGMYDQLGGGFHRYSVDDHWLVPHFEKMLYDNAQLARVYLHAWQVTGDLFYRTIVEETLDYVAREMRGPEGGFYSTQDADSEGEEGKFFVWTGGEIRRVLGDEAESFMAAYGVKPGGNWEGKNILALQEAAPLGGTLKERAALAPARARLFSARQARVHPGRDEKVLTSWNGLMLAAFAEAAAAFVLAGTLSPGASTQGERYRRIAEENAEFLLHHLQTDSGRLFHTWKDQGKEGQAKVDGFLEDYAHLAEGLLALYGATFHPRWYQAAHNIVDAAIAHFWVPSNASGIAGFYDTASDSEKLITRPRDLQDNAKLSAF
jgi:uncharacterized protein YyaL (SSP411 family)